MIDASAVLAAVLARHLPGREVRSVARLGEGQDNVAYEVDGELIVRGSKEPDPAERSALVRREAELLAAVAELSTLPVPEVVFIDAEAGVLAYRKLPGVPLLGRTVREPARLAPVLGEFLSALHRAPRERMERLVPQDTAPLGTWLEETAEHYREVAGHVPQPSRGAVEAFLASAPPADPGALAFCHNDLGAEHLLADADGAAITGVIDWADAAIADPAYDLALVHRDLGPEALDRTLAHYDPPWDEADRDRAVFYSRCALLEDLAYGVGTGAREYAEAALAHLARTFAQR